MTTPNDPNSGLPSYGGGNDDSNPYGNNYGSTPDNQSGSTSYGQGYGQAGYGSAEYGQQPSYGQDYSAAGYGQAGYNQAGYNQAGYNQAGYEQQYGATGANGYQAFNNPSDSGAPLQPNGGPLPVAEPIPFGFTRTFSKSWTVYILFPLLMAFISGLSLFFFLVPVMQQITADPYLAQDPTYNPLLENPGGFIAFFLINFVAAFVMQAALYKAALRDSRGQAPTWGNLFQGIPWGQYLLVMILIGAGYFALIALMTFLIAILETAVPALAAILVFVMVIAVWAIVPFITMIPLYVLDERTSATGAFKAAWSDVKAQYWRVLGSIILVLLAMVAFALVTLGIGFLFATPIQTLAYVFIYRWISSHRDYNTQQQPQHPEAPGGYMSMY